MAKQDIKAIYIIFNFCSWIIGATCRFTTNLFSPPRNSPAYYRTFFDLHVNPVSYCLSICLVIGSIIFALVLLVNRNFVFLILALVFIAFNIALLYGSLKQKPAYYLPSLIALHSFFVCDTIYIGIRTIALIFEANNTIERGYRRNAYDSTVEKQLAQILMFQLVLVGLCIFGYTSNIIFRDYVYIKTIQKAEIDHPSTPSTSVMMSKSDLETKEPNDAAGIPHLYV